MTAHIFVAIEKYPKLTVFLIRGQNSSPIKNGCQKMFHIFCSVSITGRPLTAEIIGQDWADVDRTDGIGDIEIQPV